MMYSPTNIARQFLPVRELAPNKGLIVESIQHFSGGQFGDSWCMEFAWMVLWICFAGSPPIKRMQAVQTLYDLARANAWLTDSPVQDDMYIYVNDQDHAHHVGFITVNGNGIAGNTSADGTSSNGDRVAEHSIEVGPHVKYVHYPR